MTKQEKVAAFMESHDFKLLPKSCLYAHIQLGVLTPDQATFFYDVMVEAREDELKRLPKIVDSNHMTVTTNMKTKEQVEKPLSESRAVTITEGACIECHVKERLHHLKQAEK